MNSFPATMCAKKVISIIIAMASVKSKPPSKGRSRELSNISKTAASSKINIAKGLKNSTLSTIKKIAQESSKKSIRF